MITMMVASENGCSASSPTFSRRSPGGKDWILIAEDDEDDFLLIQEAFREAGILQRIHRVCDGDELLKFVNDEAKTNYPLMVLLDLNMPKIDGFEALRKIKSHGKWRSVPIHVLTTSESKEDVMRAYDLGVN